jgi:hypothetical protein
MYTKEVLEVTRDDQEEIHVTVDDRSVLIYNTATDATAWYTKISLADWEAINKFVNQQLIK